MNAFSRTPRVFAAAHFNYRRSDWCLGLPFAKYRKTVLRSWANSKKHKNTKEVSARLFSVIITDLLSVLTRERDIRENKTPSIYHFSFPFPHTDFDKFQIYSITLRLIFSAKIWFLQSVIFSPIFLLMIFSNCATQEMCEVRFSHAQARVHYIYN